jgi:Cu(I)/Ag(I) efflux system membrane fusion protein
MIRGELAADQKPQIASAGASLLASLPAQAADALTKVLDNLLDISHTLAADTTAGLAERSAALAQALRELAGVDLPDAPHFWHEHPQARRGAEQAERLAQAGDIESARRIFASLSADLAALVGATGVPPNYPSRVLRLRCPMYEDGVVWLQREGRARNPYYGSMMLECFDERVEMPVTGATPGEPTQPAPPLEPEASPPPPETLPHIDAVYTAYLEIQQALIKDDLRGASAALERLEAASRSLARTPGRAGHFGSQLVESARIDGSTLDSFRAGFEKVSDLLIAGVRDWPPGPAVGPAIRHAYCPMVDAAWLQASDKVENPYDPGMLRCGVIRATIPARSENAP